MITEEGIFDRTEKLIGKSGLEMLQNSRVILFGVGGVGSFAAEGLIRSGVGFLTIVDKDVIDPTNLNRQIMANVKTIGKKKVNAMARRLIAINPLCIIHPMYECYTPENSGIFHLEDYDYVIDAVDMVTAKIDLAVKCQDSKVPLISSMGTGNKLDPSLFGITDIYETSICPLAKVMRKELRNRGVESLKVLYSREEPVVRENPPGSIAFVPAVAGLLMAGEVVRDLLKAKKIV
ncbi:tRNA threonylcarbamoyladenosine dehydratase [Acetobacterium paludosum]|uniref:tRNA threonylcarbamoyladenosine dehydratase n=1 Tax=Acetobacterium paludosum TaxID=52693 RepID=A0A923HVK8_9FIRM|nr:tRNA threonylcarbamoyladenosine dehydratase [Acetobacterium paludosum]MBC3886721.1 tRNA threonylcarbamoyladenosine dehydratase [Acetobacterium paludosum]